MNRQFLLIITLLTFVPIIYFPSSAIDSFFIPSNIFLWIIAALCIFFGSLSILKTSIISVPGDAHLYILLPASLAALSFVTGIDRFEDWWFRLAGICIVVAFFFSLFQFQLNRRAIESALYIILAGVITHCSIGFLQTLPSYPLLGIIPHTSLNRPLGFFVQPNILSVYATTGIIISIYLLSSPSFPTRPLPCKALLYISLFTAGYTLIATGSRIGLIAIAISLPLVCASRFNLLIKKRKSFAAALLVIATGLSVGALTTNGLFASLNKFERLAEHNSDTRHFIYRVSVLTALEKPIIGHGMGSFPSAFREKAAEISQHTPQGNVELSGRLAHPHNEILLWWVEGGILALTPFILLSISILRQFTTLGKKRGLALFSICLPMALHTMVEQPFYSSTHQLLLFAFLLFIPYQSKKELRKEYHLTNKPWLKIVPIPTAILLAGTVFFCVATFKASRVLYTVISQKPVSWASLEASASNTYFHEIGTMLLLKSRFNQTAKTSDLEWTKRYISWLEKNIKHNPTTGSYLDLAKAYMRVGDNNSAIRTAKKGGYLFPWNKELNELFDEIKNTKDTVD